MDSVAVRLDRVRASLPESVSLVAVSKFHPAQAIKEAYDAGQRVFGESRAKEVADKARQLPADIEWHFIGHLQTNKVRQVVACCNVIQSVDSERLLEAIIAEATKQQRHIDVLLQVHVAEEETKFGFAPQELAEASQRIATATSSADCPVRVVGVMGMASNTDDATRVSDDFKAIRRCFDYLRSGVMSVRPEFAVLSMGMSHDRDAAIAQGSTMVRVGTDIFGEREY